MPTVTTVTNMRGRVTLTASVLALPRSSSGGRLGGGDGSGGGGGEPGWLRKQAELLVTLGLLGSLFSLFLLQCHAAALLCGWCRVGSMEEKQRLVPTIPGGFPSLGQPTSLSGSPHACGRGPNLGRQMRTEEASLAPVSVLLPAGLRPVQGRAGPGEQGETPQPS